MEEKEEILLSLEEEDHLFARIELIKEKIIEYIQLLVQKVNNNDFAEGEEEKIADSGIIANLILHKANEDGENKNGFNKLLYFLFKKSNGSVYALLDNYQVQLVENDDTSIGFNITVK